MGSFEKAYSLLNKAQAQAVDTIDGPVLVIAGPGTGKTQLLSLRVANILRQSDVNPGNILCLTYTESGQQAMQRRLLEIIGEPAKKIEVHTFHGFGTHLIKRYQDYFSELDGFRAADDLALFEALGSSFENLPYSSPIAKQVMGKWVYLSDAAERISQCKQAGLSPQDVANKVAEDTAWCQAYASEIVTIFDNIGRLSIKYLPAIRTSLGTLLNQSTSPGSLAEVCLQTLRQALADAEATGKTIALASWKRTWLTREEGQTYFKPVDQLIKLNDLANLYKDYETTLQKQKLFDYDDMILFSLKALESNPELLSLVQETYQYILADEYQDTNPAQARIIELIADNPVNEGRPNVMVVGDDDQAIYGFQGAMGDVMLHFREHWRNVAVITLIDNYRSTQGILDTARSIIQLGTNRLENQYHDINKQIRSNSSLQAEPKHIISPTPEDSIESLVKIVQTLPQDSELAIIASKHKYLEAIAERLNSEQITYFYEGRDDLLSDDDTTILLLVAEVCLAIKEQHFEHLDYVLPQLLTYQFAPVEKQHAWLLSLTASKKQQHWWEIISTSSQPHWQQLANYLSRLVNVIKPSDALVSLQQLRSVVLDDSLKDQTLDQKLSSLVAHAATYSQSETVSLNELLHYVARCRDAAIKLETRLESGDRNARIVLLSAHKSKGQEFETVYIMHADEHTWFKEKGRLNKLVLPISWQYLQPARETFDDRLRLLYVVLTRAKKEVYLLTSDRDIKGRSTTLIPGTEELARQKIKSAPGNKLKLSTEGKSWEEWYMPTNTAEKTILQNLLYSKLSSYHLSPSHLTAFLNLSHGGPVKFLVYVLLGVPEVVSPEAVFGSRIHACLGFMQEQLNATGKLPSKSKLKKYVVNLASHPLPKNDIDKLVETVINFQSATNCLQPGSTPEYSFHNQNITFNEVRLSGTVDRYDVKDSAIKIVDYKTGRTIKSWGTGDAYQQQKLHRFKQQLRFYELLVRLSPVFRDIKSIEAELIFVEPTKRGNYYRLELQPNEAEQQFLQSLIQAVWQCITKLEFPDTSAYETTIQGIEQFEADLISSYVN